jgi:cyclopropane fatty-acyl-phospholipid synthase-like methyltransferase
MDKNVAFNEEYYERGLVSGISGYMNYSWMPEMTLRMVHFMIAELGIDEHQRVLDYGCAKGYIVKAFRLLGIEAYGVDVSSYAISQVPVEVSRFCKVIEGCSDPACFPNRFDWLISKDVFEHIPEDELRLLLRHARDHVERMFIAVPFGLPDGRRNFVIPSYDSDVTHITIKPKGWWDDLFLTHGWNISRFSFTFRGVKENWTQSWPEGNGFYVLDRAAAV